MPDFVLMVLGIFPICNFPNSGIFLLGNVFKKRKFLNSQENSNIFIGFAICQIFQRKRIGKGCLFLGFLLKKN
jgi:hypothetical protein